MPGLGQPPARIPSLGDLTDVDLTVDDGAVASAALRNDGNRWRGKLDTPFVAGSGDVLDGPWTTIAGAFTGADDDQFGYGDCILGDVFYRLGRKEATANSTGDSESYNLATGATTTLAVGPDLAMILGMPCCTLGGTLYVATLDGAKDFNAYFPDGDTWVGKAAFPLGDGLTVAPSLVGARGRVWMWSAANTGEQLASYDPITNTWTTYSSSDAGVFGTRRHSRAGLVTDGTYLYLVGAEDGAADALTVTRYDPVSDTFDAMASLPAAIDNGEGQAIYLDGYIYTTGNDVSATMAVYSVQLNQWETLTTAAPAAVNTPSRHRFGVWNGRIVCKDQLDLVVFG